MPMQASTKRSGLNLGFVSRRAGNSARATASLSVLLVMLSRIACAIALKVFLVVMIFSSVRLSTCYWRTVKAMIEEKQRGVGVDQASTVGDGYPSSARRIFAVEGRC